jgi:fructose-bisphosphate aldolase class II
LTLCAAGDLLARARSDGYGIGAFNVITVEVAEGVIEAAEAVRAPLILQVSENVVAYHRGAIEPLGAACLELGAQASIPVGLHLDHATTLELCKRAVEAGFRSIMFDASELDDAQNAEATRAAAQWAHSHGVWIEGELGAIGGKRAGASVHGGMTDPEEAVRFVERTGIDALAIAVGTQHAMVRQAASIDLDLIARIRARVDVPLVLHGSSGVRDQDIRAAVERGIVKVNVATRLSVAFTAEVRRLLTGNLDLVDPRRYIGPARDSVAERAADFMRTLGAAGHA